MMPDLPNVGWERDLESFLEFFENPAFRTDGLKVGGLIPCCSVGERGCCRLGGMGGPLVRLGPGAGAAGCSWCSPADGALARRGANCCPHAHTPAPRRQLYPTLVIRGTGLYELWKRGLYRNYPPDKVGARAGGPAESAGAAQRAAADARCAAGRTPGRPAAAPAPSPALPPPQRPPHRPRPSRSWWTWWRASWRWCRPGCACTASSATSPCPSSPAAWRRATCGSWRWRAWGTWGARTPLLCPAALAAVPAAVLAAAGPTPAWWWRRGEQGLQVRLVQGGRAAMECTLAGVAANLRVGCPHSTCPARPHSTCSACPHSLLLPARLKCRDVRTRECGIQDIHHKARRRRSCVSRGCWVPGLVPACLPACGRRLDGACCCCAGCAGCCLCARRLRPPAGTACTRTPAPPSAPPHAKPTTAHPWHPAHPPCIIHLPGSVDVKAVT